MTEEPLGVTATAGRCGDNGTAYEIGEAALLTENTANLFPDKFPEDFSILIVARPKARKTFFSHKLQKCAKISNSAKISKCAKISICICI